MRTLIHVATLSGLLATLPVRAQQVVVIMDRPIRASALSGFISDPTGSGIANATIEVIDCPVVGRDYSTPHHTLAFVKTNERGDFLIDGRRPKEPYCLYVGAPGFNWVEVQVKLSRGAGKIRLTLPIAS